MEYFVGEGDSVGERKRLYVARKEGFITVQSKGRNSSRWREREKRSHRKPNTMVIRGESASSVLRGYQSHPPPRKDAIQPYPPVARH